MEVLRSLVARSALPQQVLFSGPSGTGKTTLARLTAAALLCKTDMAARELAEPCQQCETCQEILTPGRVHPDVREIDAASSGRVDEIRELAQSVQLSPQKGSHRVVIIDEVHGLTASGGSAFLKLLEEPPKHVVFLLATTDPEKMLLTNRSRVTELPLQRPTSSQIVQNLQRVAAARNWALPDQLAAAIADATDPALGVRGTLMTLQKVSPLLEDSPEDLTKAYTLLGTTTPALLGELRRAYRAGDRPAAWDASQKAASVASDQTVLAALLRETRQDVDAALQANDDQALAETLKDQEELRAAHQHGRPLVWAVLQMALRRSGQALDAGHPPAEPGDSLVGQLRQAVQELDPDTARVLSDARLEVAGPGALEVHATPDLIATLARPPHAPVLTAAARKVQVQLRPAQA